MKQKKMTESELSAIVNSEKRAALGYIGGDLTDQRSDAMEYYLGEPFGNEQDGYSQVVSTDVAETIEWMMPSLMRIFTTNHEAVCFDPRGPEDEEAAEQETDYVNHVFYKKNEGFLILYTMIKDALLQKTGVVKTYVEKESEVEKENYEGLTEQEFMLLLNDPEREITAHDSYTKPFELPDGSVVEETYHDVECQTSEEYNCIEIDNIPPEEFLISNKTNTPNPKDAPFIAHRRMVTVSELREQGYPDDKIELLGSDEDLRMNSEYWSRRMNVKEETDQAVEEDPSMKEVEVTEAYLMVDYNGDGIAELRKVTFSGSTILDNEEVDYIPFSSITPIILTHKFFGLSVADIIMDIQLIKSTIQRQMLDNMYRSNHQMIAADFKNVNLDDLINRSPMGVVRTKGAPANSIFPIPHQPIPGDAFSMLDYLDNTKESRTGVGKQFQGLNADTLKDANIPAVHGLVTAAQQRVEMIARIFAETGIKDMFKDIHELCRKYPNKPEVVRLRGKWVEIDPREWKRRNQMSVNVGLGTSSQDSKLININQIIQDQTQAAGAGAMGLLLSPENVYNALAKKAKLLGFSHPEQFWTDPKTIPPAPPQPPQEDPIVKAQSIKSRADAEVAKMKELMKKMADDQKNSIEEQKNAISLIGMYLKHAEAIANTEAKTGVDLGKPGPGAELDDIVSNLAQLQQGYEEMMSELTQPPMVEPGEEPGNLE